MAELGHWAVTATTLVIFLGLYPRLRRNAIARSTIGFPVVLVHLLLYMNYRTQKLLLRQFTRCMRVFGEGWWLNLPEHAPSDGLSPMGLSVMAMGLLVIVVWQCGTR